MKRTHKALPLNRLRVRMFAMSSNTQLKASLTRFIEKNGHGAIIQLAESSGVSRQTIYNILQGKNVHKSTSQTILSAIELFDSKSARGYLSGELTGDLTDPFSLIEHVKATLDAKSKCAFSKRDAEIAILSPNAEITEYEGNRMTYRRLLEGVRLALLERKDPQSDIGMPSNLDLEEESEGLEYRWTNDDVKMINDIYRWLKHHKRAIEDCIESLNTIFGRLGLTVGQVENSINFEPPEDQLDQ